jgi:hypothetical protein
MAQLQPNIGDCVPQDRQCAYNATVTSFCATIVAVGKQYILHILSVCVCILALVMRRANCVILRQVKLSSVGCLVLQ